ncbi:MAG: c-type cytochrome [Fuerstiella sp.]|nr:c-type cytochrome [Fuerstiella sp.]MCP4857310.1 c-type cytochrome [Fuerstiella sp.]
MNEANRNIFRSLLFSAAYATSGVPCLAQGLSPEDSVRKMNVPDGFEVSVVAAEPLVRQPVAIEFDGRGRLWVIQYLQYPNPAGLQRVKVDQYSRTKYDRIPKPPPHGPRGADRITILEDIDGDGRMDRGKDFVSGLNLTTGIAFGHGGVFVLNVPYLLFYPDKNGDDVPDSNPDVLLTGFGMEDAHSVANSLTWGPDGWLYGCQGSTVTSHIRGHEFQQGVWRYHPVSRQFELFCEGGGNSWGLDFDRTGNLLYSTNYGNYVLLHGVQGGYYVKSFAKHGELHNPHTYGYFNHAQHKDFRGGHVTVGGIIYQGDSFPAAFRGKYIAGDLLGHGVYWHHLKPHGSTIDTMHGGELLESEDPWFAPTDVTMGPDGAVYVTDWHDARTAHPDPDADWDRSNGRIVRIAAKETQRPEPVDFAAMNSEELLQLHRHASQWFVRKARMELAYRSQNPAATGFDVSAVRRRLREQSVASRDEVVALESLWSLAAVGGFNELVAENLLTSPHAAVRSWTVRLLGDVGAVSEEMAHRLDHLAEHEPDVHVRQQLACTARRLPANQAVPIINANINRDIDNEDPYLPLLWWWAVEHHSIDGRDDVIQRFVRPTLWRSRQGRDFLLPRLIRRYAADATGDSLTSLTELLHAAPNDEARQPLWSATLQGWSEQRAPDAAEFKLTAQAHEFSRIVLDAWKAAPADLVLTALAVRLEHEQASETAKHDAFDQSTDIKRRVALLDLLAGTKDQALVQPSQLLAQSQQPEVLRQAALRLLARFDEGHVTTSLIRLLSSNSDTTSGLHSQIRSILLARPSSTHELLAAVEEGDIKPESIPLEQIRQVALLNDTRLDLIVAKHWGRVQSATPGEKLAEVRRLNNDLNVREGNVGSGKLLFGKHCAACHTLFGEGTKLGPDLTTANRKDRNYLLISLVDPDSVIRKEFVSVIVQTTDGRVLTGLPVSRNDSVVTLADGKNKQHTQIATSDIEEIHDSLISLMPGDIYRQFTPQQLRDLFSYLQSDDAR